MKKALSRMLVVSLLLSLAILPTPGDEGYPMTIVDSTNRTITIDKPVERIIPFVTWSYEPLYVLGLGDEIVGVTSSAL
jgi:ABC-type Fe3+-hydroxamate transport system substrate-binding protein